MNVEHGTVLMLGDARVGKTRLLGQFDPVSSNPNGQQSPDYVPTQGYLFGDLHTWPVSIVDGRGQEQTYSVGLRVYEAGSSTRQAIFAHREPIHHRAYLLCFDGNNSQSFVKLWETWWPMAVGWILKAQESEYLKQQRPFLVFLDLARYLSESEAQTQCAKHREIIQRIMPPRTHLYFNTPAENKEDARHLWSEIAKQIILQNIEASQPKWLLSSPRREPAPYLPRWLSGCLCLSHLHDE